MLAPYRDEAIDVVVGMESRGFIFSAPMAYQLGRGPRPGPQARQAAGRDDHRRVRPRVRLEHARDPPRRDPARPAGPHRRRPPRDRRDRPRHDRPRRAAPGRRSSGLAFLVELDFLKGRDRLAGPARHERHPVLTSTLRPHPARPGPRPDEPTWTVPARLPGDRAAADARRGLAPGPAPLLPRSWPATRSGTAATVVGRGRRAPRRRPRRWRARSSIRARPRRR